MRNIFSDDGFIANSNLGNKNRIFKGAERRRYYRRTAHDRRAMVRFEPAKDERRARSDRRTGGVWDGRDRMI